MDLEIYPTEQGLSARGVLSGVALRECVRCLAEYEEPMQVSFAAEYRIKGQPKGARTGPAEPADFEDTDEDVYPYDGERLEMAEMLREQVILSSPMQPLCRQDCLGLCQVCGQNRNQGPCSCPEPQDARPFAALRDLEARSSRKPAGPNGSTVKRSNSSRTE
ncbi:MAG: YceD family protein [Phycisphaerales bacterium]